MTNRRHDSMIGVTMIKLNRQYIYIYIYYPLSEGFVYMLSENILEEYYLKENIIICI